MIPALAVVGLAAMSIPLGVGGWGVREVSVSILAGSLASSVEWAVTSSAGYGLLAAISTLPGAITLMVRLWRRHQEKRSAFSVDPPLADLLSRYSVHMSSPNR